MTSLEGRGQGARRRQFRRRSVPGAEQQGDQLRRPLNQCHLLCSPNRGPSPPSLRPAKISSLAPDVMTVRSPAPAPTGGIQHLWSSSRSTRPRFPTSLDRARRPQHGRGAWKPGRRQPGACRSKTTPRSPLPCRVRRRSRFPADLAEPPSTPRQILPQRRCLFDGNPSRAPEWTGGPPRRHPALDLRTGTGGDSGLVQECAPVRDRVTRSRVDGYRSGYVMGRGGASCAGCKQDAAGE
jgi:hypothetical protein